MTTIEELRDHAEGRHPLLDHPDCPVCVHVLEQRKQTEVAQ